MARFIDETMYTAQTLVHRQRRWQLRPMFHPTYLEARQAFRKAVTAAGGTLRALPIEAGGARASDGSALTIDIGVVGDGPRTLVLSSGVHGVEGYIGSATQLLALELDRPADLRLVLIHAVNPFGMANHRRVNENNVDLNRNFLAEGEAYEGGPEHYLRLRDLLNPTRPAWPLEFPIRAGYQVLRHGFHALKQAVAGGQYEVPKGLFFGGHELQESGRVLLDALPDFFSAGEQALWIDLHSGLGKRAGLTFLVEAQAGTEAHRRATERFGPTVQAWDADGGVAYAIRGGFPSAIVRCLGETVDVLTVEYGTIAPLAVLKRMVMENRIAHHGGDRDAARRAILEAFGPEDPSWRRDALDAARDLLGKAMA